MSLGRRVALAVLSATLLASTALADTAENKRIVVEFYTQAFIKKDLQAARQYLGDVYAQHNPAVKSGPAEFLKFAGNLHATYPQLNSRIMRAVAEDDLVILHVFSKRKPDEKGTAIVDFFRVSNGRVVEHWDVKQAIPDTVTDPTSMF
jgi:predicted SnoaL-like aldol condensation-catalyzing enzyme